jgi:hypothetical protein
MRNPDEILLLILSIITAIVYGLGLSGYLNPPVNPSPVDPSPSNGLRNMSNMYNSYNRPTEYGAFTSQMIDIEPQQPEIVLVKYHGSSYPRYVEQNFVYNCGDV